jgi:hypothetical protein
MSIATLETRAATTKSYAPLTRSDRSCCCTAAAQVRAVIPAGAGNTEQDLLLCGHHLARHRDSLLECGAVLIDATGELL